MQRDFELLNEQLKQCFKLALQNKERHSERISGLMLSSGADIEFILEEPVSAPVHILIALADELNINQEFYEIIRFGGQ